jgi:hypothetical protein
VRFDQDGEVAHELIEIARPHAARSSRSSWKLVERMRGVPMLSRRKRLVFAAIMVVASYIVVEGIATAVAWSLRWDTTLWLYEDSGRTVQFDPIRGYRLTRTPSRFLRATDGRLEYVGTIRGNSQGFPDRDDFGPKRTTEGVPRIAVFGDSFTDGQNLGQNWPDRAEDLAREAGKPVELLNFALSGAGLANWWSILTKLVVAEDYEIDGLIFVVFAGDLRRNFTVSDHRSRAPLFGRAPSWDPNTYPASLDAARSFLNEQDFAILSPAEFERAVQGQWPRGVSRPGVRSRTVGRRHPTRPGGAAPPGAGRPHPRPCRADRYRPIARGDAPRVPGVCQGDRGKVP